MTTPKIQYLKIPAGRRIIVISDIHGNFEYLTKLLKKINYKHRDFLIIDGDIVEKGPESLKTLTFLMMLSNLNDVYFTKGNCDEMFMRDFNDPAQVDLVYNYILSMPNSLWWEMFKGLELEIKTKEDFVKAIPVVHEHYRTELDFLDSLPLIIETPQLTFVHAGLNHKDFTQIDPHFCIKNNAFMDSNSIIFDKWLIVGHWPVSNYGDKNINCNPHLDYLHRVISIDGGNMIKKFGQLNALIISGIEAMNISYDSYEEGPTLEITKEQKSEHKPVSIHYGDNEMIIVEPKGPITRVRQKKTGYAFALPTHKLYEHEGHWFCLDYTDYLPALHVGEKVFCYEFYDGRYLVKKDGIIGWYEP